ncbi:MAG: dynamin family protein [Thermoanaerobaculia bacterium]
MKALLPFEDVGALVDAGVFLSDVSGHPLTFPATTVVVSSAQDGVSEALVQAVSAANDRVLGLASIQLVPSRMGASFDTSRVDGIWLVCSFDRYEFKGSAFLDWADQHRRELAELPVHAFTILRDTELADCGEPIMVDQILLAGSSIMVVPLLLNATTGELGGPPGLRALQNTLLQNTLLLSMRRAMGFRTFADVVETWDSQVAGSIDRRRLVRVTGATVLDAALVCMDRLRELREAAQAASRDVEQALETARQADEGYPTENDIRAMARRVALAMNDGRKHGTLDVNPPEIDPFAKEFQQVRARGLALMAVIVAALKKRGKEEDAETFQSSRDVVGDDLRIILLGPFSSGKSTFLNTLLGLTDEANMLPASGRPETSTINEIVFGAPEQMEVHFLKTVELRFFSESEADQDRWKINREEIGAFLAWLRGGDLDLKSAKCERFERSRKRSSTEGWDRRDEKMLSKLGDPNSTETHIDATELESKRAVVQVSGLRFTQRPDLPNLNDSRECFEWAGKPAHALQIEKLVLRRNIAALDGLQFVDTPGTDSLVSHHHWLARDYIEEFRTSPVICVFNGRHSASKEDARNLEFLKRLQGDIDRLFFVITKKRIVAQTVEDEKEIRDAVQLQIRDAGLKARRVYFVDSLDARRNPSDPEWLALLQDLKDYVDRNRTEVLRRMLRDRLHDPVASLLRQERTNLSMYSRDAKDQIALADAMLAAAELAAATLAAFEDEVESVKKRLFRWRSRNFVEDVESVDKQLASFDCSALLAGKRDAKIRELVSSVSSLDPWQQQLVTNVENAENVLHAALTDRIAHALKTMEASIAPSSPSPDFQPLMLASLRDKAAEPIPFRWLSYSSDLSRKTESLREILGNASRRARNAVDGEVERAAKDYRKQIKAFEKRTRESEAKARATAKNPAEEKKATEMVALLERFLREFAAIDQ